MTFADTVTSMYPARLNFGLESYQGNWTITIKYDRPRGWRRESFQFGPLTAVLPFLRLAVPLGNLIYSSAWELILTKATGFTGRA